MKVSFHHVWEVRKVLILSRCKRIQALKDRWIKSLGQEIKKEGLEGERGEDKGEEDDEEEEEDQEIRK